MLVGDGATFPAVGTHGVEGFIDHAEAHPDNDPAIRYDVQTSEILGPVKGREIGKGDGVDGNPDFGSGGDDGGKEDTGVEDALVAEAAEGAGVGDGVHQGDVDGVEAELFGILGGLHYLVHGRGFAAPGEYGDAEVVHDWHVVWPPSLFVWVSISGGDGVGRVGDMKKFRDAVILSVMIWRPNFELLMYFER